MSISVNHMAASYPAGESTRSIQTGFIHRDATATGTPSGYEGTWHREATTAGATDTWADAAEAALSTDEKDGEADNPNRLVDVVNRYDGRPRQAIRTLDSADDSVLVTNAELIAEGVGTTAVVHQISANCLNLKDAWVIHYTGGEYGSLEITRIDP